MKASEVNRFNELYERHLKTLKLQGKAQKTIDAYSRDGFLHSNSKKLLALVQLILHVRIFIIKPSPKPAFKCPHCGAAMLIVGVCPAGAG